jgi:hypothetical protein
VAVTQVGILIEIGLFLGVRKLIIWAWGCQAYFDATYHYFVRVSAHCRGPWVARLGRAGNKRLEVREIMFRDYVSLCLEMIWPPRARTPGDHSSVSGARPSTARQCRHWLRCRQLRSVETLGPNLRFPQPQRPTRSHRQTNVHPDYPCLPRMKTGLC